MNKHIRFLLPIGILVSLIIMMNCEKTNTATGPTGETTGTFTDSRDNHIYKWVKNGTQTWMAENFAFKPSSGEFWAYNNDTTNVAIYGYLYSWETAQTIAPAGWHLPSQTEWETLVSFLGGSDAAYAKLLEAGTVHWGSPNSATNISGFTACITVAKYRCSNIDL